MYFSMDFTVDPATAVLRGTVEVVGEAQAADKVGSELIPPRTLSSMYDFITFFIPLCRKQGESISRPYYM